MQNQPNTTKVAKLFTRTLAGFTLAMLACLGAYAATPTTTTITVNATGSLSSSTIALTGTATLTNIGSGTFSANLSLLTYTSAATPFTITLTSGTTGTLTGTVNLANFLQTTGTGAASITGGTGNLSGAIGSFPSVTGSLTVSTSFTLTFTGPGSITIGGGGGTTGPPPTITQILNNYGLIPAGFTNSGIAQGSLFIIKGANLADPNAQAVLQSSASPGLQTTLNGASVKVTVGNTTTVPVFYYAIAAQLALVLPSNTPVGNATLTVSYGGQTSSPASFQVVQSGMGFDAYYGTGSGLGVATNNATGALYNYTNSIPPGTTVVLWGSGLGADPTRDTTYSTANINQITNLAHIYIGGLDAPIVYQGPSGYPGLNQVDVTIPQAAATGCNVSLVGVTAAGVPTNFVTLPIGNGVCSDPAFGTNGNTQQTLSGKTTVNVGDLFVFQTISPVSSTGTATQTTDIAEAIFDSVTGASIGSSSGTVSLGGCIVTETGASGTTTVPTTVAMDAGTVTVTGPVGGTVTLTSSPISGLGLYYAQLAAGAIPTSGGTFTFNATGGTNAPIVGKFTASLTFPNPILTWSNPNNAATVTRSAGLGVSWTGGASGTYVIISGGSSGTVAGQSVSGAYTCIAPVSAGSFTVPSYVLATLPAGSGSTAVSNYTSYQTFTAPNLDYGTAFGGTSQSVNTTYN